MNPSRGSRLFAALLAACALAALPPFAQELSAAGPDAVPEPSAFGTADLSVASISARAFVPLNSATLFDFAQGRYLVTPGGQMSAPLFLPDGALIEAIEMDACDTSASGEAALALGVCPGTAEDCTTAALVTTGGPATPGCGAFATAVPLPYPVVANATNSYVAVFLNTTTDGSTKWRNARVLYRRQVSPPPLFSSFGDVPIGHPLHQYVEALVASGVTAGCGGGNFCPNSPVTRGQMAVFLAKALGLHWPL